MCIPKKIEKKSISIEQEGIQIDVKVNEDIPWTEILPVFKQALMGLGYNIHPFDDNLVIFNDEDLTIKSLYINGSLDSFGSES